MKKSRVLIVFSLVLMLSLSLISANWFSDFFNYLGKAKVTGNVVYQQYGFAGTYPNARDFDGDGKSDFTVYNPSNGRWYISFSSGSVPSYIPSNIKNTDGTYGWGYSGTLPASADFDGDGKADLAVYNPNGGKWYFIFSSGVPSYISSNLAKNTDGSYVWGFTGTLPAAADYDGDGKADLAVFAPSTGRWYFVFSSGSTPSYISSVLTQQSENNGVKYYAWGFAGTYPASADYDGDGKADMAILNPVNSMWYFIFSNGSQTNYTWGPVNNYAAAAADFNGDGLADKAVYYSAKGNWTIDLVSLTTLRDSPNVYQPPFSNICTYGQNCDVSINDVNANTAKPFVYNTIWVYHYADGSKDSFAQDIPIASGASASYTLSRNISTSAVKTISKVELRIATLKATRSKWSDSNFSIVYSSCLNECNIANLKNCSLIQPAKYSVCGNWDSDPCLEWGNVSECEGGFYCNPTSSSCTGGSSNTCNGPGMFCSTKTQTQAKGVLMSSLSCISPNEKCYQCNSTVGYTYNSAAGACILLNCNMTCTDNPRGICIPDVSSLSGATLNTSLTCCDTGNCFICNSGSHRDNNTCINNLCSGEAPNVSLGMIIGPNSSTGGSALDLTWNYSLNALNTTNCKWKCMEGYHKENNTCAVGVGPCEGSAGCSDVAILNSKEINGSCLVIGQKCYQCNEGFAWNESACVRTCPPGQVLFNDICIPTGCDSGCSYNGECLPPKFRLIAENNTRIYCSGGKVFREQKNIGSSCVENYECSSNFCLDNKCIDRVAQERDKYNIIKRFLCSIRSLFGDNYDACLSGLPSPY